MAGKRGSGRAKRRLLLLLRRAPGQLGIREYPLEIGASRPFMLDLPV